MQQDACKGRRKKIGLAPESKRVTSYPGTKKKKVRKYMQAASGDRSRLLVSSHTRTRTTRRSIWGEAIGCPVHACRREDRERATSAPDGGSILLLFAARSDKIAPLQGVEESTQQAKLKSGARHFRYAMKTPKAMATGAAPSQSGLETTLQRDSDDTMADLAVPS